MTAWTSPRRRICLLWRMACLLLLLMTGTRSAVAQTAPDSTTVYRLEVSDLCSTYGVDARLLKQEGGLADIMDSLKGVEPNAYPLMSQWCRQQRLRLRRMATSLRNDYTLHDGTLWIDSAHCIPQAGKGLALLDEMAERLMVEASAYDELEQRRLEAERQAAAERQQAEQRRLQEALTARLEADKDSIRTLHKQIVTICDARGVTDKGRIKELKDIYYAYLSVYNKYELSNPSTDDEHFRRLDDLRTFQCDLLDSVLGMNSFAARITAFEQTLRLRTGKVHTEVYKSYMRAFKNVQVPVTFKSISEYRQYTDQLRDLLEVQQSYLYVVDLRDSISQGTAQLQLRCSKRHRDVYNSYKDLLDEFNSVPSYTNLAESRRFIDRMHSFMHLQEAYASAVERLEIISMRGDSIVLACPKNIGDVATAYRDLEGSTDLTPRFINQASIDRYEQLLDDFEAVQRLYADVIGVRSTIASNGSRITTARSAPRGLVAGYRQMLKYTNLTPYFNSPSSGRDFINSLNHFIGIQEKFLTIERNDEQIDEKTRQLHLAFKEYSHLRKAYERMLKLYDYELSLLNEADINTLLKHQEGTLAMQASFEAVAASSEKSDYNLRLKGVKETDKIKLIMGIR